ncbi:MAG: NUDIX hydrolase [Gemmatimonadota bacterium]|nr:NUDIX hydrolase [Gemmatimonadota bacterium]MDH3421854.1 NUDIX hydrolase [Gemmatimonadota bacterium]
MVETAGGVVLREIDRVPHVLVIRDPYKKWGLPKGHIEEGETRPETALREVAEETGLSELELGPELITIDWEFRAGGERIHKFATFFLMFCEVGDPAPALGEGITETRWVPLDDAHRRISYQNASAVVKAAQERYSPSQESTG